MKGSFLAALSKDECENEGAGMVFEWSGGGQNHGCRTNEEASGANGTDLR